MSTPSPVAEQILYGRLPGRIPPGLMLDAHVIDPSRLGLDEGYYENVQGYSGCAEWVIETMQLPKEYTSGVEYRCDADRDALLTLFAISTEGNPSRCIDTEITQIDYAPTQITIDNADGCFSVSADRLAAIVQLLGPGDWHYLAWKSYGKALQDHYLAYASSGSGDFRKRCSGIVLLRPGP